MSLEKITDTEKGQYGVTLLPNVPTITANALKQKFEEKSDDLIIPKYNKLIDALMASTGASEVGAKIGATETTTQGAIDIIKAEADAKQDALTFDNTPTDGSTNPVTSDGVYEAVKVKMTTSVYDSNNDGKVNSADTADTLTGLTASVEELNYVDGVTSGIQAQLNGKANSADVPTALSDLTADSTHRTVTDAEKSTWNGKSTVSVTQVVSTGTKVATVTVDGQDTDIYSTGDGGDAYKTIKVGTTSIVASGSDTFELKAGSNVSLTPDAVNKSVTISATGGGQSTGDMLMADYDPNGTVKTDGGIEAYVGLQTANNYSTSDTAETGIADNDYFPFYDTSASGKKKSLWSNIKAVLKTYFDGIYSTFSGSYNDLTNKPTIPSDLDDLSDVTITSPSSDQTLKYDGNGWVNSAPNNGTFNVQQNGTTKGSSTANQSGTTSANIITDEFYGTTATVSSGSFSFSGLDDTQGWAYKPYVSITGNSTNKNPTAQISSISGAGTASMSVTYSTDADNGATVKLRIIK